MLDFAGRVAVVTGAAGGLGGAFAHTAARAGMKLVVADCDAHGLERAAGGLRDGGAEALALVCDLSRAAHVGELADAAMARFHRVHLVFNGAVIGRHSGGRVPVWEIGSADLKRVLDGRLWSAIHAVRVFVPLMLACAAREAGYRGHLVNTVPIAGRAGAPASGIDAVAHDAVVALSVSLRDDLRLAGAPIGVSVLCRDRGPEAASDADAARLAFDAVTEDRFLVFAPAPAGFAQYGPRM